jgi:NhaA family Na+:H+ antiporter
MDRSEPTVSSAPPEAWEPARRVRQAIASPIQRFLAIEASSGLLLMAATAIALIWANSPWSHSYEALWHVPIGIGIGSWSFVQPVHFWINDGLMTIFFLVVGLEIRREIFEGELSTIRRAALPLAAALGGMLVPAAIYFALNNGKAGAAGWGIPMATDIAFAVGVLTLLGSRVPNALRILLLALAVIDDIGAILVIAVFYSGGVTLTGLGISAAGLVGVLLLRSAAVRSPLVYIAPGIVVWAGLYMSGVHPTLAGVLLGLVTPVRPWFGPAGFAEATKEHLAAMDEHGDHHDLMQRLREIERARKEAVSPVERIVHVLQPYVAYGIMPLFALANAGVVLGGADLGGDATWIFVGVIVGLALGKPIGIVTATILSSKVGLASRSPDMWFGGLTLVGMVGGIGFTMSLFIAQLAFPPETAAAQLATAKLGILVGSAVAMVLGLVYGVITLRGRKPTSPD